MLSFFPMIQEDELFFSLFARYHERSLNKSEKITINELGLANLNPLIPNNIQNFIERLELFDVPNKEHFLNEHTLFNYFCNFFSPYENKEINRYMVGDLKERNATVKRKMDLNRYSLKFCPHCVRDNIEKYGESHWKISHQLPTAFFCLKHNVILEEWNNSQTEFFLKTVKLNDLSVVTTKIFSNKTLYHAKKITKQSINLNKKNPNLNLNHKFNFGKFYLLLFVNGYVKQSGKVNVIKLEEDMRTFYGNEFLNLVKFNQRIYEQIENNPLICNMHFTFIETLLFINFFFKSILDFMKYNYILPSGETGPFPCMNYFCIHFKQNVIKNIRIFFDDMKKYLQIEFKCNECNYWYEIIFRIWDGCLIETIVDKSEEWKTKVANLVYNKSWSIEKASNKLHISTIEIEKILLENKFITWIDPVIPITEINNTIDWVKRDRQVLLYLKAIVRKAIIRNKPRRVYWWILRAVDNINIKAGLSNLQKTREYIEIHQHFHERLYKKESIRV